MHPSDNPSPGSLGVDEMQVEETPVPAVGPIATVDPLLIYDETDPRNPHILLPQPTEPLGTLMPGSVDATVLPESGTGTAPMEL